MLLAINTDITIAIIAASLLLFLLCTFIIAFSSLFQRKKQQYKLEKQTLEQQYQQQILQTQLEIQEQTFNTISNEIHDNVGQILSLAKVQLNILEQGASLNISLLEDAKDSISKAMTDLRDIAKSLNSDRIKQFSLYEITEQELQRINRAGFVTANLKIEGEITSMHEQKKLIIFRIMQETFNNIIKHAKAKNIDVHFYYQEDFLKITIADNGNGFDKELIKQKDGLGLRNIISRTALIGGTANIESTLQQGTIITITSPYE